VAQQLTCLQCPGKHEPAAPRINVHAGCIILMQAEARSFRLEEVRGQIEQRRWCLMKERVAQTVIERLSCSAHPAVGYCGHGEALSRIGADHQPCRPVFSLTGEYRRIYRYQVR
jgi:hypothetical protein